MYSAHFPPRSAIAGLWRCDQSMLFLWPKKRNGHLDFASNEFLPNFVQILKVILNDTNCVVTKNPTRSIQVVVSCGHAARAHRGPSRQKFQMLEMRAARGVFWARADRHRNRYR